MSELGTEIFAGETTSTLMPTVTRLDSGLDVSPVSIALAVSIVFILLLVIVSGNSIILVAFYRYKRLRTASNCLLVSLAVSDLGVGVFMPFGMHLELTALPESGVSTLCIFPYCIVIALCSVSVLVTVAIAVDRLTSLAQPLRYKNIITHSSIEKYIAVFWIYAIAVGLSPLIYSQFLSRLDHNSQSCRFREAISPPVRIFLVLAVWAPSALILLGCYMYVYLVARSHARAIYTVELSFRHQTQTLALPRYGQTLAVTVGAFFILWLPFQTCMLVDIFCGTNILSDWTIWLGLPILAHSGANPWIYAFHHGEMRVAAGKIAEDLVALIGVTPSRYGCSPTRRGSNTNLELAEVNNSDERRPVEDCFAAKQHNCNLYTSRRCLEISGKHLEISPEKPDIDSSSESCREGDIVEENIHDLTKMLDLKYIIDRNHVIDSNHNIDKIKNLKYLLDPTFNKIRYLRRLNHKRLINKNLQKRDEPKFTSYQNLKSEVTASRKSLQLNTMSDPALNVGSPVVDQKHLTHVLCHNSIHCQGKDTNLSSLSDSNIKAATGASDVSLRVSKVAQDDHRFSDQNLDHHKYEPSLARSLVQCRHLQNQRKLSPWACQSRSGRILNSPSSTFDFRFQNKNQNQNHKHSGNSLPISESSKSSFRPVLTITPNKPVNVYKQNSRDSESYRQDSMTRLVQARKSLEILKHYESSSNPVRNPPEGLYSLKVPSIHSEPPSPIESRPLASLEEEPRYIHVPQIGRSSRSPTRHSDPIPAVFLSIEDCSPSSVGSNERLQNGWSEASSNTSLTLDLESRALEFTEALSRNLEGRRESRVLETIFTEHDSTRYSSRRPSDSKWSESSRSQEILSNVTEQQFPSSYSVNNFQNCTSGSDLNDVTSCLDPFMCPDALSSSLRESFFAIPSAPDSDIFTSFEETEECSYEGNVPSLTTGRFSSVSSVKIEPSRVSRAEQSRSTESVFQNREDFNRKCRILRLEPSVHRRGRVRPCKEYILEDHVSKKTSRLAPLATPTPTDICTPTFDIVSDIKGESGIGVRV